MPLSIYKKLSLGEVKPTITLLLLADLSIKHLRGILEDVLMKVNIFIFPSDFVIFNMEKDLEIPTILRRPFFTTKRILIDIKKGKLTLWV